MHLLKEEWENLGWETNNTILRVDLVDVTQKSQEVEEGWGFFALDGSTNQGKTFVSQVLKKKPSAIFLDKKYQAEFENFSVNMNFFFSSNFATSFKLTLSRLFSDSLKAITLLGVTGTNGKTTIALSLKNLVESMGKKTMYIGTLGTIIRSKHINQTMTTPDVVSLHHLIEQGVQEKVSFGFIEVSSHALDQGRVQGFNFFTGAFTNLSHDHLDYHKSMENYYRSKKILFENMLIQNEPETPNFIVCTNELHGQRLAEWLRQSPQQKNLFTYSFNKNSDLQIHNIKPSSLGYQCEFFFEKNNYFVETQLLGLFNLLNLACVFLGVHTLGFPTHEIIKKIINLKAVSGRMEPVYQKEEKLIVIDYSHTPEALKQALMSLKELRFTYIRVVFGCGGDRDQTKRAMMGKLASELADELIITNDNPRSEDPQKIAEDIQMGCLEGSLHEILLDREQAIRKAIVALKPQEALLIAGKGHENYQMIQGQTKYFSDHEVVKKVINL